ncbi:cytochrome b561 / ferric reductase transmembrane domain-containing protein [Heterostelium album PN500]|uniref:Cytochrome b561 / ferric reductase transmembrane domain-containing protein n=1 Tax=Heterostelium pallidum (strain ATCC 26659 / Pp 5 / PN500) TaxID=670386 RepID=D3BFG3_HETP5|nr:cytochrome b561 / ferric reductase transmembrane domain-containing protein [Heterostelium album PN500]EFA79877.1 cytochrome b561 / ferric reductase transmembrane domain-containing protein [Heterostelium album PN500]|eukprot:XP_020431998.1 cytochrome b561 / ferric reductase transmembrane domain-containing protein [Heterostelium album PN500]
MNTFHKLSILILSIVFLIVGTNALLSEPIVMDQNTGFQLQWEIDNGTITFAVSANVQAWIAIGWHTYGDTQPKAMVGADFVVATFGGQANVQVWDMVSTPGGGPPPINDTSSAVNGTYDILSYSGFQTSDYSYFIFSRKLVTGDKAGDNDIVVGPAGLDVVWAHGSSNDWAGHGYGNAGRQTIDLGTGSTPPQQPDWFGYHVGFMFFTFAVLMPFGIFVARYLKESHMWWFPIHIFVQVLGLIFTIIGLAMALKMVGGISMATNHAILGTTTLCLFYISIFLGATSHFMWNPQREKTPLFPDIIHWIGGRLTLVFGFVTIILGMLLAQISQGIIVVFGITFASYFVIFGYIEFYKWKWPTKPDGYHLVNGSF